MQCSLQKCTLCKEARTPCTDLHLDIVQRCTMCNMCWMCSLRKDYCRVSIGFGAGKMYPCIRSINRSDHQSTFCMRSNSLSKFYLHLSNTNPKDRCSQRSLDLEIILLTQVLSVVLRTLGAKHALHFASLQVMQ